MLPRPRALQRIAEKFRVHPVVVLLGPRQCGKTTLARVFAERGPTTYFDLEDPVHLRRLEAPMTVLRDLSGTIIIDEVQRRPDLFELIRVIVDRHENDVRFLLLGSASLELVRGTSESLAGRIGFVDLSGFNLEEVGPENSERLFLRGGFPRSFLAADDEASMLWREDFIRTFLERDLPQLGITVPSETLRRFWMMIAHYHGQLWNAAEYARSLGTSENTARRYLDILAGAFVVRILAPWFENISKRQVRAPKIYLSDSGFLHTFLGLSEISQVRGHPKGGASWEGFAMEQVLAVLETSDAFFWATHGGAELDLMVIIRGHRFGFEFKYADAPGTTRSMRVAIEDLSLEHLWVVYPGREAYSLDAKISVLPVGQIPELRARFLP